MQLESLKIFCDVVRWASFSRGAAENGISQSSASQAVHQLEARLGVKLIDRSKRPLVLTPQGKVYYEGCRSWSGATRSSRTGSRRWSTSTRSIGTVGVASIYSVGMHHMSRYVKTFEDRYPEASVRLEYLHPTRVVERVVAGEADLGLISYPRKWPELTVIPWREEVMVLAVHPSHRFAGRAGRGRPRAGRRAVRGLRRRAVDPSCHRPLPPPSRCERRGRARVRQHREHQAGRRDPRGRLDPPRASVSREVRAGSLCSGADRRAGPEISSEPARGHHPPPARQPRPDGLAIPGIADRDGDRRADPAPTRIQSSRAGRLFLVSL